MSSDDKRPDPAEPDADADEVQDPELLAELMAWFGGAGHEELVAREADRLEQIDPALRGSSAEPGISEAERERRLVREEVLAAIDMTLVGALEETTERYATAVAPLEPPAAILDASITTLNADTVEIRHGVGDRAVDPEIPEALGHCTPQALLRDLHRVVKLVPQVVMEPTSLGVPKMTGKSTHVDQVMGERYIADVGGQRRAFVVSDTAMTELHAQIRDEPWDGLDIEPSKEKWHDFPAGDIALWFAGIDPSTLKEG